MKNALESSMRQIHAELVQRHAEFCACEHCSADVIALALNKIRPRYVSQFSPIGEIVTDVQMTYDQSRAELTVLVFEAMRTVASSPRHRGGKGIQRPASSGKGESETV
jgi:competence protein ComFB